jgi:ubiquinone/menaquinone biosynthesis C-methylase UbiE
MASELRVNIRMNSKDLVKRTFSERASEWAESYADSETQDLSGRNLLVRRRFALQAVEHGLPYGSKILDAGCGPGEMAAVLMQKGYEVWGMDIAEPMVRHARERCKTDRFRVGDLEGIPFPDSTFDGVVCLGVLEYLDTDARALQEISRVLKPGGTAVLSTPNAACPLYQIDRVIGAGELLYASIECWLRKKPMPPRLATFGLDRRKTYLPQRWLSLLRNNGFEPEERMCFGWGWYHSRFSTFIEFLAESAGSCRRILERVVRGTLLQRAGDRLARTRALNWVGYEQLVRLRATK